MLGRKKTIFVGSVIMVIGAAIQCSSFSLGQLIASRFITGFGNGKYTFPPHITYSVTDPRKV
jgi:MFS family permease